MVEANSSSKFSIVGHALRFEIAAMIRFLRATLHEYRGL